MRRLALVTTMARMRVVGRSLHWPCGAVVATGAGDAVASVAAEPVVLAPAAHPDTPSVASSAATTAWSARPRIVRELLPN